MSIGNSGRIVIEVEPDFKRSLYSALTREGLSLKEWFLREAETYVSTSAKISFLAVEEGLSLQTAKESE